MRAAVTRAGLSLAAAVLATAGASAVAAVPGTALAAWISPADVVADVSELDGEIVTMVGEAIGDEMRADADHVWINVLGDGTAVGVYVANEDAAEVDRLGDYDHTGDRVSVRGVVNLACEQHGGDLDVHAVEALEVLAPGEPLERYVPVWEGVLGVALIVVAGFLFRAYRGRRLGWVEARRR
jgi:hypothetical protein